MRMRGFIVPAMAALVLTAACGGNEPPPPPAPTGPTQAEIDAANTARQDSIDAAEAARAEAAAAAERAAERRRQQEMRSLRTTLTAIVQFEYDMADITPESEQALRAKVGILRNSPDIRLRLEGHADERGSNEYNQALGSARAQSVKDFLTGFGISADRFGMVSYGEERPLVNRSDEDAWAQNRRVEFKITAGQIRVSDPDDSQ
ncbi:MAG: OmpA family protein [Longimicrobiales bacterium]